MIIPQELPGTLEQGLPTSRSHTPEHMRREVNSSHGLLKPNKMPRTFSVNEQAFVPANEHLNPRSSARSPLNSTRIPRATSLPLETTFAEQKALNFSLESPNSIFEACSANHTLSPIWMSTPMCHRESEEDQGWDSESSLSSVYTALEGEPFELAV
ncbi:ankyrin repeat protein [Aspergillus saccharolyticus JOP 1030-1]|uniref:Uncharacterized protein n=1 Tax=Aspergillus saccharolyticus JOP 1030-1 TaxID=1450539 RepID=A0A318ZNP8_9EURO|nr:hypothetical protein BP01DRAFT_354123 [Aspergillus saccharolyticus JOP 1030-1]PYH48275.1 hypothetical protein BP01DRAFT_354123 [Aspergillus saccharolyticus JOP 1030-1]